jgi:hypothetical protein
MTPQCLPTRTQTFVDLREWNYLYVDKTREILALINSGKSIFLSRFWCFYRSLPVSALEEIFRGNRKIFEGLYIEGKNDWNERHLVITEEIL